MSRRSGLHEGIGTQTTREIAPATNRNAQLVERRRSRQNRLSKPPGEIESEVASLGRQRQVNAPERRAQRRAGSTQLLVVVRTTLARPTDADTTFETQPGEKLGLEHHGGGVEAPLANRPRERSMFETLHGERPARRTRNGRPEQRPSTGDVGVKPVVAEQPMRDRRVVVTNALTAKLGFERKPADADGRRQALIESRAADALRKLGEHPAAALHVAPTEVEMDARTDITHGLGNVRSDTADVRELAVPIDDCATPGLHQQTLGKVHPDVGTGDPAEDEIGAVDRRAVHGSVRTFGGNGRTQHEGVDTDAVERRHRGPDDTAKAGRSRSQSGRIDLFGPRLRHGGGCRCEHEQDQRENGTHRTIVKGPTGPAAQGDSTLPDTDTTPPPTWLERVRRATRRAPFHVSVIEPFRVGVDIDGVIASRGWKQPPWTMQNGWEQRPVLDAEGLAELAHRARSDAWEVYAITARPTSPGSTTQQQTRRWFERHDACELSVIVDRGKRVEIARGLELDWFVDDTLEQCCAVQLETSAVAIWIAATPSLEDRVAAESAGCVIAASLEEAIAVIDDG